MSRVQRRFRLIRIATDENVIALGYAGLVAIRP